MGSNPGGDEIFSLSRTRPDRLWRPPFLSTRDTRPLSGGYNGRSVALTGHLHLVLRSSMSGVVPLVSPSVPVMACHGMSFIHLLILLRDKIITTDTEIIIIIIIIKRTCMLIDVAIPGDRNVIKKEAEKILKYKDLTIEIQRMWNVKTRVKPVIIGATGTISRSFRKYVSDVPGNHDVKELQKTAILGTAHILGKVLT